MNAKTKTDPKAETEESVMEGDESSMNRFERGSDERDEVDLMDVS